MTVVSWLVGDLSPVNHRGLHQGQKQTQVYLLVIHEIDFKNEKRQYRAEKKKKKKKEKKERQILRKNENKRTAQRFRLKGKHMQVAYDVMEVIETRLG